MPLTDELKPTLETHTNPERNGETPTHFHEAAIPLDRLVKDLETHMQTAQQDGAGERPSVLRDIGNMFLHLSQALENWLERLVGGPAASVNENDPRVQQSMAALNLEQGQVRELNNLRNEWGALGERLTTANAQQSNEIAQMKQEVGALNQELASAHALIANLSERTHQAGGVQPIIIPVSVPASHAVVVTPPPNPGNVFVPHQNPVVPQTPVVVNPPISGGSGGEVIPPTPTPTGGEVKPPVTGIQGGGELPPSPVTPGGEVVPPTPTNPGGETPDQPTTGGEVKPQPNAGGELPPDPNAGGEVKPVPNAGGEIPPAPNAGGEVKPLPNAGGEIPNPQNPGGEIKPPVEVQEQEVRVGSFEKVAFHQGVNDMNETGTCGVASQVEILNQLEGKRPGDPTAHTENELLHEAVEKGWYEGGTTLPNYGELCKAHGLHVEQRESSLPELAARLANGEQAQVSVNAGILWNDPSALGNGNHNHAVNVSGADIVKHANGEIEIKSVWVNDTGTGESHEVSGETFQRAWETSNYYAAYVSK